MTGMVGQCYTWRGRPWRVITRWRTLDASDPELFVAQCCGHIAVLDVIQGTSPLDETLGDDSYCGSCGERWTESRPAGHVSVNGWQPGGRASVRNVLIEDVESGERVVRPFRGLRKPRGTGPEASLAPRRRPARPEPRERPARALARPESALGWELRGHMAARRVIRAALSDRCDGVLTTEDGARILEGYVSSVSATDAFAIICGRHVPLVEILRTRLLPLSFT